MDQSKHDQQIICNNSRRHNSNNSYVGIYSYKRDKSDYQSRPRNASLTSSQRRKASDPPRRKCSIIGGRSVIISEKLATFYLTS